MTTTEEPPTAALLTVNAEPIQLLDLDGHRVTFKNDPLADQAWADLVGLQKTMAGMDPADGEAVQTVVAELKRILGEFVVDGKPQWTKSKSLGFKSLALILEAYVKAVTDGIPT